MALFATPDAEIGWLPTAFLSGVRITFSNRPSWLISSGPTHTAHLVARLLKAILGARWLADLRDPWAHATRASIDGRGPIASGLNRIEERHMVGHADLIVLNTDRLLADFSARYPDSVEKLFTIPNGYDLPLPRVPKLAVALDRKPVRLIHAGSLYGRRDPLPLLSALADLIAAGEVDEEAVELVFLGELSDKLPVDESMS